MQIQNERPLGLSVLRVVLGLRQLHSLVDLRRVPSTVHRRLLSEDVHRREDVPPRSHQRSACGHEATGTTTAQ
jgi:hypothetical protein